MAAKPQSWIFVRMHYLKNNLSNQFQIFIDYWDLSEDVHYQISGQSKIQYGCQAAILDFLSGALSQEGFKQSIQNFTLYWDKSGYVRYQISGRSEIKYGHQAAILDFLSSP